MKFIKHLPIIMLVLCSHQAFAGANELKNQTMPCAVLTNGKVVSKNSKCVVDITETANMHGASQDWTFRANKNYQKTEIIKATSFLTDKNGDDLLDETGEPQTNNVVLLNGQDADFNLRMPNTFKILTTKQTKQYYEGKLKNTKGEKIKPYQCYHQIGNPKFEFCFIDGRYN
jgi:hypothetical protein